MTLKKRVILTVGCAGGFGYNTEIPVTRENAEGEKISIRIHGLLGGHFRAEIHKTACGNGHKNDGKTSESRIFGD